MNLKRLGIAAAIAFIYASGYVLIREAHILVHASSYHSPPNGAGEKLVAGHRIQRGDFVGLLQPGSAWLAVVSDFVFIPLKYSEAAYWYFATPVDGPWPYDERTSDKALQLTPNS
jgi:hypothetical protein